MKKSRYRTMLIYILFLTLLISGFSKISYADMITGIITQIEGTRVAIQEDQEKLTMTGKSLEEIADLSVGDYVEVVYFQIADTFVIDKITILEEQQ